MLHQENILLLQEVVFFSYNTLYTTCLAVSIFWKMAGWTKLDKILRLAWDCMLLFNIIILHPNYAWILQAREKEWAGFYKRRQKKKKTDNLIISSWRKF